MPRVDSTVFRSAVDLWFYLVLAGTAGIVAAATLPVLATNDIVAIVTVAVSALLAIGLPLWLLFSTNYTVTPEMLIVRSGPLKWAIPRSEIRKVRPSRSILSSPALSINRLEITYGAGKSILVSPVDRIGFIKALGFDT